MAENSVLTIHTDGASRGNPGEAAFAYVITRSGHDPIEVSGCLGTMTNNAAEYTALVRALDHAGKLGSGQHVVIHSDSELMVKQMRGEYQVKNAELKPLYQRAQQLCDAFAEVTFRHVRRENNKRADELCNEALDGRPRPASAVPRATPVPTPASTPARPPLPPSAGSVRERALTCLREAASVWGREGTAQLTPETVWDQLADLLQEHWLGQLRAEPGKEAP